MTKLSEVIEIIGGGTPKRSMTEYWNGDISWISIKDFKQKYIEETAEKITELGLNNSSTKLLQKNDLVISARGTVGEVAMIKEPMAFNQSIFGLRVNKDILEPDYLYYWLKLNIKKVKANVQGSVFDTITKKTFEIIDIDIPTLNEQQKIVSFLNPIDDEILLKSSINDNLYKFTN